MRDGLPALSDREKETLRLLLAGHDAKSIARKLGLSVHTINERLRDARRKLAVSSSREAARLLGEAERDAPYSLGDKPLGVAAKGHAMPPSRQASRRVAMLGGGIVIMSLIIAAAMLASAHQGSAVAGAPAPAASTAQPAGLGAARDWLVLLDQQRWKDCWDRTATIFQARVTATEWATKVQSVRQPLGAVTARSFKGVTEATSLPGAPDGQYEIIQFKTGFAAKADAVETVVLARETAGWKVAGYFIR